MRIIVVVLVLFLTLQAVVISAQENVMKSAGYYLKTYSQVQLSIARSNIDMEELSKLVSIDNVTNDSVYFIVNEEEYYNFLKMQLPFSVIKRKSFAEIAKLNSASAYFLSNFNTYPTYEQYDTIMQIFASTYPAICQYVNLGTLPSGRKILALHISDNITYNEAEPRFLYTSTMHGDETTGYILMLKLADYLLSGYGNDSTATHLVNSLDIWINPLANPDGTYHGGNSTVSGAIRNNANSVNLNRNYPDPDDGPHPDGHSYQPETNIFMAFADTMHFTMSANFHGGAEVVNYPWDTWSKLPADVNWWKYVSHEFADTARFMNGYNGYMDDFGTGVTNGYQWYTISGGRQDYMNYYKKCREVTIELSATKLLPENQLNTHWLWNKKSLINYMKQAAYGLHGTVRDYHTAQPLKAKVFIANYDMDSSHVFSALPFGDYYRMLDSGYYKITYSAAGYISETLDSVRVDRHSPAIVKVELMRNIYAIKEIKNSRQQISVFPNPAQDRINIIYHKPGMEANIRIYTSLGVLVIDQRIKSSGTIYSVDVESLEEGNYYFTFSTSCTKTIEGGKLIIKR